MKGIFANRSALFQASILTYLFLTGLVTGSIAGSITTHLFTSSQEHFSTDVALLSFYKIHTSQFFSCTFSFLLPSLITAYLCSNHPKKFLHIRSIKDARIFILTFPMVYLLSPAIDLTSYLNSNIQLPEFMEPVEKLMRETKDQLTRLTESLLSEKGVIPFIVNITVIAGMAGIAEEFIFRGAILRIVGKKIKNQHVAIWLVAVIFSAMHFQFYGFIPRIFLGAFLGYLLYWSQSIWVPVFAHFLNNATIVTANFIGLYTNSPIEIMPAGKNTDRENWIVGIIVAVAGLFLFALCARLMKKLCSLDKNAIASSCEAQNHDPDISHEQSH
ncbi:MAG: CPBP family intramembrane metalloprotease [Tannerella sp.]|jgi:membrane protease YdiL (CAAX protease family)|nr:CPBP family intramembrane metalloprotease [Tannerella sp.]